MSCWPTYLVGFLSIGLLIFDLVKEQWSDLPLHAGIGIIGTGIFYILCLFLGSSITGALLIVPFIAILFFALGIWMTGQSLQKKGCCVKCTEQDTQCEKPQWELCKLPQWEKPQWEKPQCEKPENKGCTFVTDQLKGESLF